MGLRRQAPRLVIPGSPQCRGIGSRQSSHGHQDGVRKAHVPGFLPPKPPTLLVMVGLPFSARHSLNPKLARLPARPRALSRLAAEAIGQLVPESRRYVTLRYSLKPELARLPARPRALSRLAAEAIGQLVPASRKYLTLKKAIQMQSILTHRHQPHGPGAIRSAIRLPRMPRHLDTISITSESNQNASIRTTQTSGNR
jgi:hypothetical protein